MITRHYIISGRVQGVWFRAGAQDEARRLGLTGWVRNLPDGKVEAIASGEGPMLDEFYTWLLKGPPMAEVDCVTVETMPWLKFDRFSVK